jgi:DNA-binding NtrC family response regulator
MRSRTFKTDAQLASLVGASRAMVAIRAEIEKVADSPASVLITGPSGSGKDVAAQMLHQKSQRAARPFVALNCAAVARDLLESEMFGHEAGAFTGAVKARAGRFEAADGGTLFLDEVGDMSPAMQAKLLRALETRVVERVGGMLPIHVDVRLIAATSVDLHAAIDRGLFRADLLYRLDVIHIEMPSLAERPEDIPLLVEHFSRTLSGPPVRFNTGALVVLMEAPWPGNVRELKNFVERAKAHFPGEVIGRDALPKLMRSRTRTGPANPPVIETISSVHPPLSLPDIESGINLRQLLSDLEQAYIRAALAASGGTVSRCARLLGLQRTTLIEKMRRLHISSETV